MIFASGSTCGDADKNTDGSGFVSTGSLSRFLSISLDFFFFSSAQMVKWPLDLQSSLLTH